MSRPAFPALRLRRTEGLLDLPWEQPLAEWPDSLGFRELDVGPSRHLVRFLVVEGALLALKEEPTEVARREYAVLGHLERVGLPAVKPVGVAEHLDRSESILVTEYLAQSLQFRRLLARFPLGPGAYRSRLLDAMAWLLVDLHRGGVFWGDCSLANTLFRRDGDRIEAYLVDAETSEVHPSLSDGQRAYDLEILVENVGYGLADVAALQNRPEDMDTAIEAAESVRERYRALWAELHEEPALPAGDRQSIRARLRRLNELGYAVDEIAIEPGVGEGERPEVRLRVTTSNRAFHAHELERLTGLRALEGQARVLLNDLREYVTWLRATKEPGISEAAGARRWLVEVLEPTLRRLRPVIGIRDPLQAYIDVLEHKWLLSEAAKRDVGLEKALAAYLDVGAPAPEPATITGSYTVEPPPSDVPDSAPDAAPTDAGG
jgi:hypothetical protein